MSRLLLLLLLTRTRDPRSLFPRKGRLREAFVPKGTSRQPAAGAAAAWGPSTPPRRLLLRKAAGKVPPLRRGVCEVRREGAPWGRGKESLLLLHLSPASPQKTRAPFLGRGSWSTSPAARPRRALQGEPAARPGRSAASGEGELQSVRKVAASPPGSGCSRPRSLSFCRRRGRQAAGERERERAQLHPAAAPLLPTSLLLARALPSHPPSPGSSRLTRTLLLALSKTLADKICGYVAGALACCGRERGAALHEGCFGVAGFLCGAGEKRRHFHPARELWGLPTELGPEAAAGAKCSGLAVH
uniref:uncharacterized protein LOC114597214 isoform X1 n=1 Tax=Podarcis muralis TaxID=64176 RepID=UPI00109F2FE8|nr:uncharacterized protein LOC114597214 isoform X1 [Podarcis muralis]